MTRVLNQVGEGFRGCFVLVASVIAAVAAVLSAFASHKQVRIEVIDPPPDASNEQPGTLRAQVES
jgi:hypothetical protein